jgi:hypothetical protein
MAKGHTRRHNWFLIFGLPFLHLVLPLHLNAAERIHTAYFSPAPGSSSVI